LNASGDLIDYQDNPITINSEITEKLSVIKTFDSDIIDTLIITTDGVSTFQEFSGKKVVRDIPITEVFNQLSDFKVKTPGLCQRKLNRMSQVNPEKGIFHYDDLGAGVILCP